MEKEIGAKTGRWAAGQQVLSYQPSSSPIFPPAQRPWHSVSNTPRLPFTSPSPITAPHLFRTAVQSVALSVL